MYIIDSIIVVSRKQIASFTLARHGYMYSYIEEAKFHSGWIQSSATSFNISLCAATWQQGSKRNIQEDKTTEAIVNIINIE